MFFFKYAALDLSIFGNGSSGVSTAPSYANTLIAKVRKSGLTSWDVNRHRVTTYNMTVVIRLSDTI